jgi:transglutaminase-like putative cysteine protease
VCQVHVLCTLGARQKPDLLFFNSFLVAVVTAFLTQDLLYSAVFLAYAPLLVLGLSLYAAETSAATGAIVREALRNAALALCVTAIVFFAWPRDFRRKGLVVESLELGPAAPSLEVGFAEDVRLGRRGDARSDDSPVLRVHLVTGDAGDVPAYWRGATQLAFDGVGWSAGCPDQVADARWRAGGSRELLRDGVPGGPELDVELIDPSAGCAFLPLTARRVEFTSTAPEEPFGKPADGTLRFTPNQDGHAVREVRLSVELAVGVRRRGGGVVDPPPAALASPADAPPLPAVAAMAGEVLASLPSHAPQYIVVEHLRERLASRHDYLPPGSPDAARDIDSFVAGRAGGHCEHFAGALALLLRHAKIPCRLATGYASEEWGDGDRILTLRRRDAHAWVEVKDPEGGWYTVDPTPATARAARRGETLLSSIGAWFGRAWERVVRFDDDARGAILAWLSSLPGRTADLASDNPASCGACLAFAITLAVVVRRRRAARVPAEVRAYRACLARLRLASRPGETPRELVRRAGVEGLPGDAVDRLAAATQRHESARYATRRVGRRHSGSEPSAGIPPSAKISI